MQHPPGITAHRSDDCERVFSSSVIKENHWRCPSFLYSSFLPLIPAHFHRVDTVEVYWALYVGREMGKQSTEAPMFVQKTVGLKSIECSGTALHQAFCISAELLRHVQIC